MGFFVFQKWVHTFHISSATNVQEKYVNNFVVWKDPTMCFGNIYFYIECLKLYAYVCTHLGLAFFLV